jgi:tetratricopeptide (TPR) repeat protein
MRHGELDQITPYISKDDLRVALNSMVTPSSAPLVLDSLSTLILVDEALADPTLPKIHNSNEFAIYTVLTEIITDALHMQRRQLGLPPTKVDEGLGEATQSIIHGGRQDSTELLYWSFLHYHYVRVELNITVEKFSELVNLAQRTIRRYRTYAMDRLWQKLILEEQQARIRQHERRLYAQLPASTRSVRLFGRDVEWRAAQDALKTLPTATILVTGATGVGKTTFVQELLRQRIQSFEPPKIDQIVWIDNPLNVGQIYNQLHNSLQIMNSAIELREWFSLYKVIVVIDDAEHLLSQPEYLDTLLQYLAPVTVFIMSNIHTPSHQIDSQIVLKELDSVTSIDFISNVAETTNQAEIQAIYQLAGGNPLALLMTINNAAIGDTHVDSSVLEYLLKHAYSQLNQHEKQTWFALALCPPGEVAERDLIDLWPQHIAPKHLSSLIQRHLVDVTSTWPQTYRLFTIAHNYIVNLYQQSSECLSLISELVLAIPNQSVRYSQFALDVMSHLSSLTWLNVDQTLKRHWLAVLVQTESSLHNHPRWPVLVTNTLTNSLVELDCEAQISYGIALRQLAQWKKAKQIFRDAIKRSGQVGDFRQQARARIELSVVLRYYGQYEDATANLQQSTQIAFRYEDNALVVLALLEGAQLAVDQANGKQALDSLQKIPKNQQWSMRYLLLISEAYFLTGNFAAFQEIVRQASIKTQNDRLARGRFNDLVGRMHLALGNYNKAHHRLSVAVSCFDIAEDPFALARCLSNLGATLLCQGKHKEAENQLMRAHHIQSKLKDALGLTATEHNIQIYHAYMHNLASTQRPHSNISLPNDDEDLPSDAVTQ